MIKDTLGDGYLGDLNLVLMWTILVKRKGGGEERAGICSGGIGMSSRDFVDKKKKKDG
jgi:hypothetical protein